MPVTDVSNAALREDSVTRSPQRWSVERLVPVLLFLLPSLYFGLIFWPAIAGGKEYGNRANQEKLAVSLNDYNKDLPPQAPLLARKPEMLHPDYYLLYEPANKEIQKAFRSGRLPLYNSHRILATPLWGSPVADAANPLSLLLLVFSTSAVHLIKLYVYTLVAFAGVYLCATVILNADPIPAMIGASIYLLNPFMYYMYHWANLYGVMAVVPSLLCVIHLCLVRPRMLVFATLQGLVAWVLLINQLQALLYFFLFLLLWILAGLAVGLYPLRMTLWRTPALFLSGAGGAALTLGHTWYLVQTGAMLARQPHTYEEIKRAFPTLLDLHPLVKMWWDLSPLDYWSYDSILIFFPVVILAVILPAFVSGRFWAIRSRTVMGALLCVITVHCFVRPLHYPLYLLHVPLYNLNWEQWRIVYLFYFCLGLAAAVALTRLKEDLIEPIRFRRWWGLLYGVAAVPYAILGVLLLRSFSDRAVFPLAAMAGFATLSHAFCRRFSATHVALLGSCIIAGSLYLPMKRVPFYDPAQSATSRAVRADSDGSRVMRLVDSHEISGPRWEMLWYSDSVMSMFSRDGATGYDTALQKNEARLFSAFYSDRLMNYRAVNPYLKHGVQSSIVWPETEGVLSESEDLSRVNLGKVNLARLNILGVRDL